MRVHAIRAGRLLCAGAGPADALQGAGPLDRVPDMDNLKLSRLPAMMTLRPRVYDIRFDRVR